MLILLRRLTRDLESYSKSSTAIKKKEDEEQESYSAKIIPWPAVESILKRKEKAKKKRIHLKEKHLTSFFSLRDSVFLGFYKFC